MLANGDIFHGDHHPVSVVEGRKSRNLANPADLSNRIRYYTTGADYTHVKYWGNSELIEASGVEVSISYKYKGTGNPWWSISQYDENGKFLTGQTSSAYSSTGGTRRVVGKYVSFSLWDGTELKAENNPFYDIQVEFGETLDSTPTEYVPYTSMETLFKPTDLKKSGTSLTFEQSYNHQAEVEVAGKSEQASYSGKNLVLFDGANAKVETANVDATFDGEVTHMVLKEQAYNSSSRWGVYEDLHLEANQSYTVSVDGKGKFYVSVGLLAGSWGSNVITFNNVDFERKSYTFTTTGDSARLYLCLNGLAGVTDGSFKNVQLEKGSTATEYEPYCGGIPSPNPDYPQPIESIDSVELVSRGRNLFDYSLFPARMYSNGVHIDVNNDGSFTFSGTANATWPVSRTVYVPRTFGDYIIQNDSGDNDVWVGAYLSDVPAWSDRTVQKYVYGSGTQVVKAIEYPVAKYPYIGMTVGARANKAYNVTIHPMVEAGTIAHPYEPYHSATRTIDLQGHQLRSLPDGTHDELRVKRDGSVELVKRTGIVTVGADNWFNYGGNWPAGNAKFVKNINFGEFVTSTANNFSVWRSNYFSKYSNFNVSTDLNNVFVIYPSQLYISVSSSFASNTSELMAKLRENPIAILLALATPHTIALPSIEPLPTYWPTTVVDGNGLDISAYVKVID